MVRLVFLFLYQKTNIWSIKIERIKNRSKLYRCCYCCYCCVVVSLHRSVNCSFFCLFIANHSWNLISSNLFAERIIIRNLFSSFFFFLFTYTIIRIISYSSYRDEKNKRNWCVEDSGRMGNGKWYWEITEFHLLLPRTRASIQQLRSSCARYLPPCIYTPYVTIYIYRSKDEKVSVSLSYKEIHLYL